MSLADSLKSAAVANMATPKDAPSAKAEFDGENWDVQTAPIPGAVITDFSDILREMGIDPAAFDVHGNPRVSRWQFSYRDLDGEMRTEWRTAYRLNLVPVQAHVDLPALYAEVARDSQTRTAAKINGTSTVVVCWADIQTGKVDHLGGVKELLERLEEKRSALRDYLSRTPHDHIVIADAGDIVEGFSNTPSQTRLNGLSLMDQVDIASTEFWKTIKLCAEYAPVDVLSIPSNHCQWRAVGSRGLQGTPGDDWGIHISKRLEALNEEVGLDVTFHRPASEWVEMLEFDIKGTKLGVAHGHQARSVNKVCDWWGKMTHAGELSCDVLLTGHFHFPTFKPSGRNAAGRTKWWVQASTLDNGSAWVRNSFGEDGDPALTVFTINENGFDVSGFALL